MPYQAQHAPPEEVIMCLDDTSEQGCCVACGGANKTEEPSCICKYCCPMCVILNYEGLTKKTLLIWLACYIPGVMFALVIALLIGYYKVPLMGTHYDKAIAGAPVAAKADEEAPAEKADEEGGEKVDNVEMEDFGEKKDDADNQV